MTVKRLTKTEKRAQKLQYRMARRGGERPAPSHNRMSFELKNVRPLTEGQKWFFDEYDSGTELVLMTGSAGTGKTFTACYKALREVLEEQSLRKKVIIVRSAVQGRELGHMPGTLAEKASLYEAPYHEIFGELFEDGTAYRTAKQRGLVEFSTTSFIRGVTMSDAIVIMDECQNANWEELSTVATRLGRNSRAVFCGDFRQNDLYRRDRDVSGLAKFLKVIDYMDTTSARIEFTTDDIVRGDIVKDFLVATEQYEDDEVAARKELLARARREAGDDERGHADGAVLLHS
jgi:phosphate starvation-inducible protein PhoH and related proteins